MYNSTSTPLAGRAVDLADRMVDLLAEIVGIDSGRPKRCARMSFPNEKRRDGTPRDKYQDIPQLDRRDLGRHLAAQRPATFTATLERGGQAIALASDIDKGGRAAVERYMREAAARGLASWAHLQSSSEHDGGHPWLLFAAPAPAVDLAALHKTIGQAAELAPEQLGEFWPNPAQPGQPGIRLPFGFHQINGTRGIFLGLEPGAVDFVELQLDDPEQLQAAMAYVLELERNAAPASAPEAPAVDLAAKKLAAKIASASDNPHYQNHSKRPASAQQATCKRRQPGQGEKKYTTAETLARALEHDNLAALLERHGAQLQRSAGATMYYSGLASDKHTHTITYAISDKRSGPGQIGYSHSPSGALNKTDYPHGFDYLAALAELEHGGDILAALQSLTPDYVPSASAPEARPSKRSAAPVLAPIVDDRSEAERLASNEAAEQLAMVDPAEAERHAAEAERKRAQRQRKRAQLAEALQRAAEADASMPAQARKMLAVHLQLANQTGTHTWSIAAQAERAELAERHAQLGNKYLKEHGYIASRSRGPKQTATWTLCEVAPERITMLQSAAAGVISAPARSPVYNHIELVRAAQLQPEAPAPAVDLAEYVERLSFACFVRNLAAELGGMPLEPADLAADMSMAQLEQLAEALAAELAEPAAVDLAKAPESCPAVDTRALTSSQGAAAGADLEISLAPEAPALVDLAELGGAAYDPAWALQLSGKYTERSKRFASFDERWRWAADMMRPRKEASEAEAPEQLAISAPEQRPAPEARPSKQPAAIEQYRAHVALMSSKQLAGEQKRLANMARKYSQAHWYREQKYAEKIRIVEAEQLQRAQRAQRRAAPEAEQRRAAPEAEQLAMFGSIGGNTHEQRQQAGASGATITINGAAKGMGAPRMGDLRWARAGG